MAFFKKRESIVDNIAYMALMAAINVVFVLLTTLVPFLLFLLVFILPLTSLIVTIYCKKKYFILYALATIILCLVVTIWNVGDTLFYVIPSIVSGFLFGFLIEKRVSAILIILITTLVQAILMYPMIPLIHLITGRYIVDDFLTVFHLSSFPYTGHLTHMFIILMALIQEIISFIVIYDEIGKFGIDVEEQHDDTLVISLIVIGLSITIIVSYFFVNEAMNALLILLFVLGVYQTGQIIKEKKTICIALMVVSIIITFFMVTGLFRILNKDNPSGFLSLGIYPLLISLVSLFNKYLLNRQKEYTIERKD